MFLNTISAMESCFCASDISPTFQSLKRGSPRGRTFWKRVSLKDSFVLLMSSVAMVLIPAN